MGYDPGDAFLIVEFRNGQPKALNKIFVRYHATILYFAQGLVGDTEAAKDLVPDVFVKAWERKDAFDSIKALKAFLYTTAENACIAHLRHSKVVHAHQQQAMREQARYLVENTALQRIQDAEVLREISNAIDALPPQCRRVARLSLIERLSTDDIAKLMNLAPQSVRNTRNRAAKALRKKLTKRGLFHIILALLAHLT